jgi:hypothetical protein
MPTMHNRISRPLILALALGLGGTSAAAFAAAQGGRLYMGYTGTQWAQDHGVTRGRCDTKSVAAALAASSADTGPSAVALLAGVDLAPEDKACAAHALELLRNNRTARWNSGHGAHALTTGHDAVVNGLPCRPFILSTGGRKVLGTACQAQPGIWEVVKP